MIDFVQAEIKTLKKVNFNEERLKAKKISHERYDL